MKREHPEGVGLTVDMIVKLTLKDLCRKSARVPAWASCDIWACLKISLSMTYQTLKAFTTCKRKHTKNQRNKPWHQMSLKNLSDPWWRLTSGFLYQILIKVDEETDGLKALFIPNNHQVNFIENLHYRNIILKARQLGFTTMIAIYYLDCCLFGEERPRRHGAQDKNAAESLFRDKVKFAYDNLHQKLKRDFR